MSVAIKWTGINAIHKGQWQNILLNNAKAYASLFMIYWKTVRTARPKGPGGKLGSKCKLELSNAFQPLFTLAASNSEKYDQENVRNTLDICELWLLLASMITFH